MPRKRKGGNVNFKIGRKNVSMKWTRPYILNKMTGLCAPALLYLVLSIFGFLTILFQNCKESSSYMIGDMKVDIECHNAWFFVGKALYIIAFTWLLNVLCNKGYTNISWFLVLLPFILYLVGSSKIKNFQSTDLVQNDFTIRAIGSNISLDRFYRNVDTTSVINELIELSAPNPNLKILFLWPEGIIPNTNQKELIN